MDLKGECVNHAVRVPVNLRGKLAEAGAAYHWGEKNGLVEWKKIKSAIR